MTTPNLAITHDPALDLRAHAVERRVRTQLTAGIVAGPVFATLVAVQLAVDEAFDLTRHPISLLAVGDLGVLQIVNFVLTGALVIAAAAGLRPHLADGRGYRWAPRLIGLFGVGLVVSGVFVADAENGYPVGTPDGAADLSWHGMVHAGGAALAYNALIVGIVVLAVRAWGRGRRLLAAANGATAVTLLGLLSQPTTDGASVRMAVAAVVAFTWLAVSCASARRARGLA